MNAGVKKSQVVVTKLEFDKYDDDGQVYDIKFKTSTHIYSYEIDADDGSVIESEKKKIKPRKKNSSKKSTRISRSATKKIVLKHASLKSGDVTFTEVKLDKENGIYVYDISFIDKNDTEYDYEINADSGKIIDFSSDYSDTDDSDEYDD